MRAECNLKTLTSNQLVNLLPCRHFHRIDAAIGACPQCHKDFSIARGDPETWLADTHMRHRGEAETVIKRATPAKRFKMIDNIANQTDR